MGNQHKRRLQAFQFVFQPFDGRQVQMVGRLVQQQNIGFGRERAGKCRAACLTAGQGLRVFLAGQAENLEQIGAAIGIVAIRQAFVDIVEHRGRRRKGQGPAAGSEPCALAGRSVRPCPFPPGPRRSSGASICPSRCGRPGTGGRPRRRTAPRRSEAACRRRSGGRRAGSGEAGPWMPLGVEERHLGYTNRHDRRPVYWRGAEPAQANRNATLGKGGLRWHF